MKEDNNKEIEKLKEDIARLKIEKELNALRIIGETLMTARDLEKILDP